METPADTADEQDLKHFAQAFWTWLFGPAVMAFLAWSIWSRACARKGPWFQFFGNWLGGLPLVLFMFGYVIWKVFSLWDWINKHYQ